jgi:hypothetical protein
MLDKSNTMPINSNCWQYKIIIMIGKLFLFESSYLSFRYKITVTAQRFISMADLNVMSITSQYWHVNHFTILTCQSLHNIDNVMSVQTWTIVDFQLKPKQTAEWISILCIRIQNAKLYSRMPSDWSRTKGG